MNETGTETAPEGRATARRELMQAEIYEQAARLFAERGYSGTSFQDIADAVGLTRPALYHYVRSKDELLSQLVSEITVANATDIAGIAGRPGLTPTERLREIVRVTVSRQGQQGERFRLLVRAESDLPEPAAAAYETHRRVVFRSVVEVVKSGITAGEFRLVDPSVATFGVIGIVNWVAWWYRPGSRRRLDEVGEELADMAVASLAAPDGQRPASTPRDALRDLRREVDRLGRLLDESGS